MILRNSQQDQSWAGIQKFPEKPKKKSWNSSQTPRAGGNHGLYIPTGNLGGKRGKDSKKTAGKGFIQERKIREKCQDSIGIFMEKKKELKEWNQGMIGGKKKTEKKQINPIRLRILGAKFQGKTAFPLPPATEKLEKREFPHSQMDFGGKMGFSWILSNWKEFSWNSHSKETSRWRCQDFF